MIAHMFVSQPTNAGCVKPIPFVNIFLVASSSGSIRFLFVVALEEVKRPEQMNWAEAPWSKVIKISTLGNVLPKF